MSIASLGSINLLNLNDVALGSNAQASSGGTFANLYMSNDEIPTQPGVPYATWNMGVASGTDPNIPNALIMSVATNDPVAPTNDVIVLNPTGGNTQSGNGTQLETGGDIVCGGDLITSIPSASALGTDANGKLIAVGGGGGAYTGKLLSTPSYQWIRDASLGGGLGITDNDYSWGIIDTVNNEVRIYINLSYKAGTANTAAVFQLYWDENWQTTPGALPPPNANFQDYLASNSATFFYNNLQLINLSAGPTSNIGGLFTVAAFVPASNLWSIQSVSNCNVNEDTLLLTGYITYPI